MEKMGVLITEGSDDLHVIESLYRICSTPQVFEIVDGKGFENIKKEIPPTLKYGSINKISEIERLGIVIDADADIGKRWNEIREVFVENNYSLPERHDTSGFITPRTTNTIPIIGIWIMPDNVNNGMLEDFFRHFIPPDDLLLPKVNSAIAQLKSEPFSYTPQPRSKAEIRTWLAWQKKTQSLMGYTLHHRKEYLNLDNDVARKFVQWLQRLFEFETTHSGG